MAGSSIPLTMRSPLLEIPYDAEIDSAVALGYGELDAYGFHTIEALQCMVERRKGGETGIRSVEWLEGKAVWQWRDGHGRWSIPLLAAALSRNPSLKPGRLEDNVKQPVAFRARVSRRDAGRRIHAGKNPDFDTPIHRHIFVRVGASAAGAAILAAYSAAMSVYLSLTAAPTRSTPLLFPGK